MYVCHVVARSRNHCYSGNAKIHGVVSSTLSHERQNFRKGQLKIKYSVILHNFVWNILWRIQPDVNTDVQCIGLQVKCRLFWADFNETRAFFSTDFWKMFKYNISWWSVQWEPNYSTRTDGHDKANSRSSQCFQRVWNVFTKYAHAIFWFPKAVSSRLLSKNLKIKIYRTIILPVICMGVKLGRWHCGRKGSWGCLRTWCWGEYLDLGGTR